MTKIRLHTGADLRHALDAARALGCLVERRRRTGELVISHPSRARRVCVSAERRDAPRVLTTFLRQLIDCPVTPDGPAARRGGRHSRFSKEH